jgi:transposase
MTTIWPNGFAGGVDWRSWSDGLWQTASAGGLGPDTSGEPEATDTDAPAVVITNAPPSTLETYAPPSGMTSDFFTEIDLAAYFSLIGYDPAAIEEMNANGSYRSEHDIYQANGGLQSQADAVDARMLADMGEKFALKADDPIDPQRARLADLVARREALIGYITKEKQRLGTTVDLFIKDDIATTLTFLKTRLAALTKEIAAHIKSATQLAKLDAALQSAPGIGPVVAATLVAGLPEIGTTNRRALASLAGLAPHACDSGIRRGSRHIWGGRAQIRRALYLAAFIASSRDPVLKEFRAKLSNQQRPFKAIIIAVARKLLTHLNAMIRSGQPWSNQINAELTPA